MFKILLRHLLWWIRAIALAISMFRTSLSAPYLSYALFSALLCSRFIITGADLHQFHRFCYVLVFVYIVRDNHSDFVIHHPNIESSACLSKKPYLLPSLQVSLHLHTRSSITEPEKFLTGVDEALILKKKSDDVVPYMNERCIFLVGMMGSGKTTVGKILSEVLGYSFFDSDKLVEKAVGMYSVAQIFKERSEAFFRDNESNALRDLSLMHRLVVATGGGAVIRPINWRYMKQGITVWLDVPLDALARRIAAVGTESRPLLHNEPGDPYTKALIRLSTLSKERGDAYANADARVCLQQIASKQGHGDVSALTPTAIAIEALIQIESFLTKDTVVERLTYF